CGWSRDLIAAPNDVAELFLARGSVKETEFLRPNLIENNASRRCLDHFDIGLSENCLLTEVRILETDAIVCFDRAVRHREFHFDWLGEERQMSVLFRAARILRHVIAAERDVLRGRRDRLAA